MAPALLALVVVAAVVVGLTVGLLLGRRAGRLSATAEQASLAQSALTEAVAALDQRATQTTNAAVQAAVSKIVEVNQAQFAQATEANRSVLAHQQELIVAKLEAATKAGEATVTAQTQQGRDDLAAKEQLIESRLDQVQSELRNELGKVGELLTGLRETSQQSFGRVSAQLAEHASSTRELAGTTAQLREALASSKARGQWGERMAEDVLHLAGFVEHVNYEKQTQLADATGIPDFTFLLPKGHKLFMDVKFPIASYLRYLEADSDAARSAARKQFLADVRLRVRELAKREYATSERSLNDVLLFIPNETIAGFIHEHEPSLFEDALRQHIVFCSPLTLFAMLGVIRQAYDNFTIEQQATEILGLVGKFKNQFGKYTDQLDKIDRSFQTVEKAFQDINGTRRRQLERVVDQIDAVRTERSIPSAGEFDELASDSVIDVAQLPPPAPTQASREPRTREPLTLLETHQALLQLDAG